MTNVSKRPDAADAPPLPERLGRYEVLLPIASGGMATVYLARALGMAGFEREVALKLTHAHLRNDPDFVASLIDEARLAGRIRHPHVVSVLDVAEDPHGVFIVMDYVEGDSLSNLVRALKKSGKQLPLGLTLRIVDDMLAGLHAAHELKDSDGVPLQLIHRDVTPHNVLVGIDGVTRLTDFGIAKAAIRLGQTSSGLIKGKIAYMAPEQAHGDPLTRACDVWAAGAVAWELICGSRLFEASNDAALLLRIVNETPRKLGQVVEGFPKPLEDAIARALTRDLSVRHPTAEAFAQALRDAATSAGIARAEARDVASFVTPLFQQKLDARRSKAREIQVLRRRMGQLAALGRGTGSGSAPSSQVMPIANEQPVTVSDSLLIPEGDEPKTGSAGISALSRSVVVARRPDRFVVAAAAATLLLGALALWSARRSEPPSAAVANEPPSAAPSPSPPPPPAAQTRAPAGPQPAAGSASAAPSAEPPRPPERSVRTRRAPAAKPKPAPQCNPPYVIDERGIQVFKPECL